MDVLTRMYDHHVELTGAIVDRLTEVRPEVLDQPIELPVESRPSRSATCSRTSSPSSRTIRSRPSASHPAGCAQSRCSRTSASPDGSRPDCWGYLAAYGWERDDGNGVDRFR
jgi:hypothetical protein